MGPGVLSEILNSLPKFQDENLLLGFDTSDDACVYKLREDLVAVQTVDFFPPMVDDPYLYGQIAAANSLSDIYAMGARPSLALNIVCFPDCLPLTVLRQILAGGYDKVREAGAVIAGGHTIEDDVPKYGLCVTGFAHPDEIWANKGAKAGDVLVLTKALGTGVLNTAAKADLLSEEQYRPAAASMAKLNRYACEAGRAVGLSACTDITGFGLAGHLCEMLENSGLSVRLNAKSLPLLPNALDLAEEGILPKNTHVNREHFGAQVMFEAATPLAVQDILFDPQTSGGMLLSLPEERAAALLEKLGESSPEAAVIGRVLPGGGSPVQVAWA